MRSDNMKDGEIAHLKMDLKISLQEIARLRELVKIADYIIVNTHTPLIKRKQWEAAKERK